MGQVSFCVTQDTPLAFEQLPSRASQMTAATVGRAEKSPLHFPCLCEALDRFPHLPTCLRWQWAISILSACSPARPAGGWHKHQSPQHLPCAGVAVPLGLCPSPLGQVTSMVHYKDTILQVAHHQSVFLTATAVSADLCNSWVTPLNLVNLLWDKRRTAKGQLFPMEDEMLPIY